MFSRRISTRRFGKVEFSEGNEGPAAAGVLAALRRERIAERLVGPFGFRTSDAASTASICAARLKHRA
jgi:hypothetical protein